jgi:hypothetical protein
LLYGGPVVGDAFVKDNTLLFSMGQIIDRFVNAPLQRMPVRHV